MCACVCVCVCISQLSPQVGCDAGLIIKRSIAGWNSEFSFSKTSCLTNESSMLYYLLIAVCMPKHTINCNV